MRVQAHAGLADIVEAEGRRAAEIHGLRAPGPNDGADGNVILTTVPVPRDGLVITEGALGAADVFVQVARRRADGWVPRDHRVVLLAHDRFGVADRFSAPVAGTVWSPGRWEGNSVLLRLGAGFEQGLPPSANPA